MYQANYGFTATGQHDPNVNAETEQVANTKEDGASSSATGIKHCIKFVLDRIM